MSLRTSSRKDSTNFDIVCHSFRIFATAASSVLFCKAFRSSMIRQRNVNSCQAGFSTEQAETHKDVDDSTRSPFASSLQSTFILFTTLRRIVHVFLVIGIASLRVRPCVLDSKRQVLAVIFVLLLNLICVLWSTPLVGLPRLPRKCNSHIEL